MERTTSFLSFFSNLLRFIFWLVLTVAVLMAAVNYFLPAAKDKRQEALENIQKERSSRAITLIHRKEVVSILGIPLRDYIDIDDAEAVLRIIRRTPAQKPIDLIVHTPGGLVLAASQIAQALSRHPGKVTVFIPHYAMSGGTLIALAADEIVMDPNAVLGPVDPQIGLLPAASIVKAVERKPVEDIEDHTLILADISSKALDQVSAFVTSLLSQRFSAEEARRIAGTLTTGRFTHDYPIDVARAEAIGIPVSTQVPESIYKLMDLYAQDGAGRPSVNYVPVKTTIRRSRTSLERLLGRGAGKL